MPEGSSGPADLSMKQVAMMVVAFIVGTMVIMASFVYADIRQDAYEEKMGPYDAAADLVEQVNSNVYLRGVSINGSEYDYVVLSKHSLEWYVDHPGLFEENFTSKYHYRILFDDLTISDENHYPSLNLSSSYTFGEVPPRNVETVRMTVHYSLHLYTSKVSFIFLEETRHICLMTVEVWP